jgi:hypothetical protein
MHYLAALVATKEPQLLDFADDLRGCAEAQAISDAALKQEMKALRGCCDELHQTLADLAVPKKDKDGQPKEHDASTATFLNVRTAALHPFAWQRWRVAQLSVSLCRADHVELPRRCTRGAGRGCSQVGADGRTIQATTNPAESPVHKPR